MNVSVTTSRNGGELDKSTRQSAVSILVLCLLTICFHPAFGDDTVVTNVAAGGYHTHFLRSDGSLWAMGENAFGELGDGTYISTNRPEQIIPNNVAAIAAGSSHRLFLKSDRSLWVTGYNAYGQLGDGTSSFLTNRPEQIISAGVVAIGTGYNHSLFVKSDGSLWAMGNNDYGELGDGTNANTNRPD